MCLYLLAVAGRNRCCDKLSWYVGIVIYTVTLCVGCNIPAPVGARMWELVVCNAECAQVLTAHSSSCGSNAGWVAAGTICVLQQDSIQVWRINIWLDAVAG
jgi:hypothetical protein